MTNMLIILLYHYLKPYICFSKRKKKRKKKDIYLIYFSKKDISQTHPIMFSKKKRNFPVKNNAEQITNVLNVDTNLT